ncbi:unnamed protein product [Moneuplotes crassus]|uniref:B box-type domain-containing protein n=1 Tax=Euplotes crassus TaxID=5936 RepID=A0AAD1UFT5_EUPCR|nr:unnamed protein product [Moneuplotes crassus]
MEQIYNSYDSDGHIGREIDELISRSCLDASESRNDTPERRYRYDFSSQSSLESDTDDEELKVAEERKETTAESHQRIINEILNSFPHIEDLRTKEQKEGEKKKKEKSFEKMEKCHTEEHKDIVEVENEALNCTICLSSDPQTLMICRFCGNNACNPCWERVFKQRSKCFFCRRRIHKQDLVKNLMAEQIRRQQQILDSRNDNKLTKKCPDHDKPGKLFCDTCSCFFCLQCIKESIHSGHEVLDVEENPEIKAKILESNKYCKELEKGRNLLQASIKEHSKFIDIGQSDLDIYVTKLKDKIFKRIDGDTRNLREAFLFEKSLNTQAQAELDKFDDLIKNLETLSLRTIDMEKLKTSINKQVKKDETPNVKALINTKDLKLCKNSIRERYLLGCDSTNHTKFSEYMKKTLKEGIRQFV